MGLPLLTACAVCSLLALAGCAPKTPPAASASRKPQASSRLDAIVSEQSDLKTRLDAQMNAMLALQEHMAALEDRMSMLEQELETGKVAATATSARAVHMHPKHKTARPSTHARSAPAVVARMPAVKQAVPMAVEKPKPIVSKAENERRQKQFDAAMLQLKHGDYDQATAALAQFVKRYPTDGRASQARYWLGEALFAQGDFGQVTDTLQPFESMPVATPKRAPALFRLGAGYQRTGRNADAIRAFKMLRRDYPASPEASDAARQLKLLGADAVASAPAAATPSPVRPLPAKPSPSGSQGKWAVNIVSLDNLAEARHTLDRMHAEGIHAEMMDVKVKGKLWHRLRTIGYASREAADRARRAFAKKGYADAWTGPE